MHIHAYTCIYIHTYTCTYTCTHSDESVELCQARARRPAIESKTDCSVRLTHTLTRTHTLALTLTRTRTLTRTHTLTRTTKDRHLMPDPHGCAACEFAIASLQQVGTCIGVWS